MGAVELKNRIQNFLDNADERVLAIVNGVFENYYKDQTVAFNPDGTSMTRQEYKTALDTTEEQIENGDFIYAEEFEQQEN
ncbi:hypothetical protein IMCC3317_26600 [Kordia antarctica]|uniref:Uncharacterized protein n=1 Tax=Kordia antarctica TaxID=1218801 RepID=A0A7L4ZL76_9FLAO|nr:hypothetical protein [Kordia antarctica]QHI37281.1 hypothetical protein IMCC3317_26600 [Kordia antarctica]